ncbi:MAG: hypothetical protein IJJ33_21350 [Victivallales bacterium]|nr:hypothetical protein [Victivallales bacterium]
MVLNSYLFFKKNAVLPERRHIGLLYVVERQKEDCQSCEMQHQHKGTCMKNAVWFIFGGLLILVALGRIAIKRTVPGQGGFWKQVVTEKVLHSRVKQEVDKALKNLDCQNQQALRDFQASLDRVVDSPINDAIGEIPNIADDFSSAKFLWHLAKNSAKDKLKGSNEVQLQFARLLEKRYTDNCKLAIQGTEEALLKLKERLENNQATFQAALLASPENVDVTSGKIQMQELLEQKLTEAEGLANEQASCAFDASVTGTLEVLFLRQTIALFKRLLAAGGARISAAASTGAGLAAADGPLPLGDIAGVAFTVWSVGSLGKDLLMMKRSLPTRLAGALTDGATQLKQSLRADAIASAEEMLLKVQGHSQAQAQTLLSVK